MALYSLTVLMCH